MAQIQTLQRQADSIPLAASLAAGLLGTVFVPGAVFAVTAPTPILWLTVLLSVPGFALWGAAYPICRMEQKRQRSRLRPLIGRKYDEAAQTAPKAAVTGSLIAEVFFCANSRQHLEKSIKVC